MCWRQKHLGKSSAVEWAQWSHLVLSDCSAPTSLQKMVSGAGKKEAGDLRRNQAAHRAQWENSGMSRTGSGKRSLFILAGALLWVSENHWMTQRTPGH